MSKDQKTKVVRKERTTRKFTKKQAEKALERLFDRGEINRKYISGDPLGPPPGPKK